MFHVIVPLINDCIVLNYLAILDYGHIQSLIYNYEKNSHVDFTVETRTYASVLKNGSTLSNNKIHLKRNIFKCLSKENFF